MSKINILQTFVVGAITVSMAWVLFGSDNNRSCVFVVPKQGCVFAETVNTPETREKGLSGRTSLANNKGMLFEFQEPGGYCFWMKDMKFNIDVIWLDGEKRIIDIKKDLSPATYPQAFCPILQTKYVIEVNAGVAKQANLIVGHKLKF